MLVHLVSVFCDVLINLGILLVILCHKNAFSVNLACRDIYFDFREFFKICSTFNNTYSADLLEN